MSCYAQIFFKSLQIAERFHIHFGDIDMEIFEIGLNKLWLTIFQK